MAVSCADDAMICPVCTLKLFLQAGSHKPDELVFHKVVATPKSGDDLAGRMSYSRAREHFSSSLSRTGIDPTGYCTHSLWAGGASAAALAGIPDCLLQCHSGWKCAA